MTESLQRPSLPAKALEQLFLNARTYNEWCDTSVKESLIHDLYDLMKWGPTSANCCPARFVWVQSQAGKEKLAALAMDSNRAKILAAPLTVIIGYDEHFADKLPKLLPADFVERMQQMFKMPGVAEITAIRNSSLQGAYLMIGARALGLDCGPMSGFDNALVDKAFFANTNVRSNFICSLGYGKANTPYPRNPRLSFEEACRFA